MYFNMVFAGVCPKLILSIGLKGQFCLLFGLFLLLLMGLITHFATICGFQYTILTIF